MDEFEKIKELSEELDAKKEKQQGESDEDMDALEDDAQLYHFRSDYRERLAQASEGEENPSFFRQRKFLIGGALILAVIIGVIYFKNAKKTDEIPVIMPTSNPVKVVPDAPGGMEIPDQDKVIYDRLRQQTLDSKIESLFPEAEQPVAPPVEEGMLLQTEGGIEAAEIPAPVEPKPTIVTEELDLADEGTTETVVVEKPAQKATTPVKATSKTTTQKTQKQPVKKTETQSKTTTAKTTTENWSVQLMSSTNKATVQSAWPTLQKKHSALLSGLSHTIVEANIPGKGTYYRLRVGKFASREQAANLCTKLKQRKQDCVPAK